MDELIDAGMRIIETQGIVAFLLLLQMWLSSRERAALLHKNCELNRFIMNCLSKELDEDRVRHNPSTACLSDLKPEDLLLGGVIIPPADKVA